MESIKKILEKLKQYEVISLIIAVCYFAGYFSHAYHYRILGISIAASPLDYLTLGGDFFISSVIKTIIVPIDYTNNFFSGLILGEFSIAFWLLLAIVLLQIISRLIPKKWFRKTSDLSSVSLLLVSGFVILNWQCANLRIDNVLTVHPQRIYLKYQDKTDISSCELMQEIYGDHLLNLQISSPGNYHKVIKWFNMQSVEDLSKNRLVSYSGLIFLFIATLLIWFLFIKDTPFKKPLSWLHTISVICLLVNFIFLPISYGILGRSYQVPYGTLQLQHGQDSLKNRIYVLAEDKDQYVVYDKMNFFQVKYVPRSSVRQLDQLFPLTPFQSPIRDQFSVCDSLIIIPQKIDY